MSWLIAMPCVSLRYMQSLANNLSFTRYKEVYSAAAEIVGLILKNMAERDEVGSVSVTLILLFGTFYKLPKTKGCGYKVILCKFKGAVGKKKKKAIISLN